jgi:predicted nucleotidyltransferase
MLSPREVITQRKTDILALAARHGARRVRIFGSVARDEAVESSDIDFLVELEPGRSLLDQVALQQDLGELLGCRVDVVVEGGLSPYLKDQILAEALSL